MSPKTGHCVIINKAGHLHAYKDEEWQRLQGTGIDVSCGKANDDEIIGWIKSE